MKTFSLLSMMFLLPAASLLAKGQSEIEVLRARVDVQERRIIQLENALNRLSGASVRSANKAVPVVKKSTSPKASSSSIREYVVVKGDILTRIAHRHQSTVQAIKKENNLKSDGLRIGQKLRIPMVSSATTSAAVKPKAKVETSKKSEAKIAQSPESNKALTGKHKVKSGDTFYGIARQYHMNEASLQAANPKAVPTRLQIGQMLVVKPGIKTTSSPKVAKTPKAKTSASKSTVAKAPAPKPSKAPKPVSKPSSIRTITVHQQMTYGAFANQHGASTSQLNSLNGLNLSKGTMLAKGSELYVPQF